MAALDPNRMNYKQICKKYGFADLVWKDLRGVDLREADLCEADLYKANLCGAYLYKANLERAIR